VLEEGKLPYQYKEVNPYKKEVLSSFRSFLMTAIISSNQSEGPCAGIYHICGIGL
jgi:hypothetical protein